MLKKIFAVMLAFMIIAPFATTEARSLWVDRNWSMYADRKARDVGDIVSIIINESSSTNASMSTSNAKSGNVNLNSGVGIFRFLAMASASGSDEFTAEGSSSSSNTAYGRITVTVVEVLPNNNMIIEGTQSIWKNRNEHKITVRGIIRQDDISSANTINSNQVADATLRFDGKGPLNAKQRQGILTQIFNILF